MLQFKVSSELKSIIGKELITDDYIAIFELVKNSYDARAKKVKLVFKQILNEKDSESAKIFVIDDGDGMSRADLEEKWLLVGYSWKREQQKELVGKDFRDKLGDKRIFAGAKGIGRFSCDKLGSKLRLYTKKENEKFIHVLDMDWDKFEEDPTKEFQTIDVNYDRISRLNIGVDANGFEKGTILEVSSPRERWDREKILTLKRHLQRLINPAQIAEAQEFRIYIEAEECSEKDAEVKEDYEKVNGLVRNILFEKLDIKTTSISCSIDEKGDKIRTELFDKGTFIYSIEDENKHHQLHNVSIKLFFLNQSAKSTFTRIMGIEPVNYGSVFFYKNGVKINPCGNKGDDWLGLDRRKTQGTRRFLGNRDVMGRIEVLGYQPYFQEVSSRDGGVSKTPEVELLTELFLEKALRRLERYVIEGIDWDSEDRPKDPDEIKADSFRLINKLIGKSKTSRQIEFNEDLLDIYEKKQLEKTPQLIKNIASVKSHVKTEEERAYVDLQVKAVRNAFRDLNKRQRELEEELARKTLFLERIATSDSKEVLALQHQIGLSAATVRGYLSGLKAKIDQNEPITNKDIIKNIDDILLQINMMTSITKFFMKANFDLMVQKIHGDLVAYIRQYVERVSLPRQQEKVAIKINCEPDVDFEYTFNPFYFTIIIDNLIDNCIKAHSRNITFSMKTLDKNTLEIRIRDDGIGIRDEQLNKLFSFGYSTTEEGSGVGLYHIKKVLEENGYGTISVNNRLEKGVEFVITVVRK